MADDDVPNVTLINPDTLEEITVPEPAVPFFPDFEPKPAPSSKSSDKTGSAKA